MTENRYKGEKLLDCPNKVRFIKGFQAYCIRCKPAVNRYKPLKNYLILSHPSWPRDLGAVHSWAAAGGRSRYGAAQSCAHIRPSAPLFGLVFNCLRHSQVFLKFLETLTCGVYAMERRGQALRLRSSICPRTRVAQQLHTSLHTLSSLVESRFFNVISGNRVTV